MSAPTTSKSSAARHLRDGSLVLAVVFVLLSVVPPLATEARRYVVAESIQFALLALAVPALVVLGAPFERIRPERLASWRGRFSRERPGGLPGAFLRALAFFGATVAWRTPAAVDALVRTPALVAAEIATFLVVGVALWTEIVVAPPLPARLSASQRLVTATVTMWLVWILAYFVGFSHSAWYTAIPHAHSALSLVADQELAAGVMWATAAAAFVPIAFVNLIRFLRTDSELDEELKELVASSGRSTTN